MAFSELMLLQIHLCCARIHFRYSHFISCASSNPNHSAEFITNCDAGSKWKTKHQLLRNIFVTLLLIQSEFLSPGRAQLTMLKNSIIRMTSLMHHVRVNHLEQEFISHIMISEAHHAKMRFAGQFIPPPPPSGPTHHPFTNKKGCLLVATILKCAWAYTALCDQAVYIYNAT